MPDSQVTNAVQQAGTGRSGKICLIAALAAGAALALALALWPSTQARAQESAAEGSATSTSDIFAVAGQLSANTYGLYLVDQQRGNMAVYEYVPGERLLHLRAARSFTHDLALESYNTQPLPSEVAKMVNQARRISETQPAAR